MAALVREQGSITQTTTVMDGVSIYSFEIVPIQRINQAALSVLDKLLHSQFVHSSKIIPGPNGAITLVSPIDHTFALSAMFPNFTVSCESARNPDGNDLARKFNKLNLG